MNLKYDLHSFIEKSNQVHNNTYDYSLVVYKSCNDKVSIVCKKHGVFTQKAVDHYIGKGCTKCRFDRLRETRREKYAKEFEVKARKKHGDKYDYSLVVYKTVKGVLDIICPAHGVFQQSAMEHLRGATGRGCLLCGRQRQAKKVSSCSDRFIKKAVEIHGEKYIYDKIKYTTLLEKVEITCRKHGSFWQTPSSHFAGKGCPSCQNSKGENIISSVLYNGDVTYESQKTFPSCKNKKKLRFDFFIPMYNILIEYQGTQHFKAVAGWGGINGLEERKRNDVYKKQWAINNGFVFIEYTYLQDKESIENHLLYKLDEGQECGSNCVYP